MIDLKLKFKIQSHRRILNLIRIHREISGAELSRLAHYQPSTVTYILRTFQNNGFIEISRIGSSLGSAGKPPTLWRLVANRGYIIGIEIIKEEIRATVIDFASNVIHQEIKKGNRNLYQEKMAAGVVSFIEEIISKLALPREDILGIGIALTGLVDRRQGLVHYSRNLLLKNFPLQKVFQESLNLPVAIANDSNAGALGIKWYSDQSDHLPPNIVFLTINAKIREIGVGLILNNRLYEGASGTAGELATSLPVLSKLIEKGEKKYGSDFPIIEEYRREGEFSISNVVKYAKANCAFSNFILHHISRFITDEVLRIIEFINPDAIVIGGDIFEAEFILNDYIIPAVKRKSVKIFPAGIMIPKIEFSRFGIFSVSIGAKALILREIFSE